MISDFNSVQDFDSSRLVVVRVRVGAQVEGCPPQIHALPGSSRHLMHGRTGVSFVYHAAEVTRGSTKPNSRGCGLCPSASSSGFVYHCTGFPLKSASLKLKTQHQRRSGRYIPNPWANLMTSPVYSFAGFLIQCLLVVQFNSVLSERKYRYEHQEIRP